MCQSKMIKNSNYSYFLLLLVLTTTKIIVSASESTKESNNKQPESIEIVFSADSSELNNNNNNNDDHGPVIKHDTVVEQPITQKINKTHGKQFQKWLDKRSTELFTLSKSYSGFQILHDTYHKELLKVAEFAWINFTEMIVNISKTLGEELLKKAIVVRNLTDLVEKSFDQFKNDTTKINESIHFSYYDSKSPKAFCDLAEKYNRIRRIVLELKKRKIRRSILEEEENQCPILNHHNNRQVYDLDAIKYELHNKVYTTTTNSTNKREKRNDYEDEDEDYSSSLSKNNINSAIKSANKSDHAAISTTRYKLSVDDLEFITDPQNQVDIEDVSSENEEESGDWKNQKFWNIDPCLNRTEDINFKAMEGGVNASRSSIQTPVNLYKKELSVNMTAYWTESLDLQFKTNYENDPTLYWQSFCSSYGIFRRFPAAYWKVPASKGIDFFDCRLQNWYIQAASSPKDVLILLDTSGSMTGLRLEIGKKLISFLLDTFTDNDFFNILTFSHDTLYLFDNDPLWQKKFIHASKANKQYFLKRLGTFQNTSQMAKITEPLEIAFNLFSNENLERARCNKVIMVITDGTTDDPSRTFAKNNKDKSVRVFSFKIGREMSDPKETKELACNNNGQYYHVVTLTDINEHVYQYVPVLSRPMALMGQAETIWSNVFVGHTDNELKIAVARPAFRYKSTILSEDHRKEMLAKKTKNILNSNIQNKGGLVTKSFADISSGLIKVKNSFKSLISFNDEDDEENDGSDSMNKLNGLFDKLDQMNYPIYSDTGEEYEADMKLFLTSDMSEEEKVSRHIKVNRAYEVLKAQQVLLGVVGVEVPVLRLISQVSPKYQLGVGIYIIMLDNNGFVVFHPSIKHELEQDGVIDMKGSSHSIDLDVFELAIDNEDEFELLEHEMIDGQTSNMTLENWKRDGLRVIRRSTEYVYTPVPGTPFSIAIASPRSFGRYYISLPNEKENLFDEKLKQILDKQDKHIRTHVQVYNCSYTYDQLANMLRTKNMSSFCVKYLFDDDDQVMAMKSDLVLHEIYYNRYNYSLFDIKPNLVLSVFYGTYSGVTFYLPITFYKTVDEEEESKPIDNNHGNNFNNDEADILMMVNDKPKIRKVHKYNRTRNMFSNRNNKRTYSFEKHYYIRTVEFSDNMRTEHQQMDDVYVIYFLNETRDSNRETVSAAIPLWLDKVPTAVTGAVYDANMLKELIFKSPENREKILTEKDTIQIKKKSSLNLAAAECNEKDIDNGECIVNICDRETSNLNVTCYLIDEHGIIVLASSHLNVQGMPLYKINPWLMYQLELRGLYTLILPGAQLQDCSNEPLVFSSASRLFNLFGHIVLMFLNYSWFLVNYSLSVFKIAMANQPQETTTVPIDLDKLLNKDQSTTYEPLIDGPTAKQREWIIRNNHCSYFGIYSFNINKWKATDSSELDTWCNVTESNNDLFTNNDDDNDVDYTDDTEHKNSDDGKRRKRRTTTIVEGDDEMKRNYLVGYLKYSNLLMIVIENEFNVGQCESISDDLTERIRKKFPFLGDRFHHSENEEVVANDTNNNRTITSTKNLKTTTPIPTTTIPTTTTPLEPTSSKKKVYKKDYLINRYRKGVNYCHNYYPKEHKIFQCASYASRVYYLNSFSFIGFLFLLNYLICF